MCVEFSAACNAGQKPRLEDYCQPLADSNRPSALEELLRIELDYRRRGSDSPTLEEYELRFPEDLDVVRRAYGASASRDADTVAQPPSSMGSGLQIRCPHCSNQVELIADTPFEEITCHSCGSTFNLVQREDRTQGAPTLRKIGRFDLISRLGVGGFGTVWKARDAELDRTVAIKIPRKGQLQPEEIEQFFREARAAAQLRHPNIVPVHEVGREGETIFIVGDLVRGIELSDWLTGDILSFRESAALCETIALALHHAHERGIVHRDLKPSNIMLDEEHQPHLMDFGLAKREVGEITMTVDGQILGTPAYMSPEQASGKSHWTDRRTDIYSLGVILFRLLTSELPFRGNAQMQIHQRLRDDPPSPRKLNRHVPRDMATICLKCMERDPNRRYSTAQAVADELERFLTGVPIQARPISSVERTIRWSKRNPALAVAAALTLLLAIAGPLAAWRFDAQRRRLAGSLEEKDNLIVRYSEDQQQSAAQLAQLTQALDVWEGRTNPWKFWPPDKTKEPRKIALRGMYEDRFDAVANALGQHEFSDWKRAQGRIALAYLADATGRPSEAIDQFRSAQRLLATLASDHPDDHAPLAALAQCHADLGRLLWGVDDDDAAEHVQDAVRLYGQLDAQGVEQFKSRVEQLDLQLRQSVAGGWENGAKHLVAAAALEKQLSSNWPNDPTEIYNLTCYLIGRTPLLLDNPKSTNDP